MLDIDPQGSFSAWVGVQKRFSELPLEGRRAEAERLVAQARLANSARCVNLGFPLVHVDANMCNAKLPSAVPAMPIAYVQGLIHVPNRFATG
jgi:cellulose biosynthesis protein BcsQ